MKYERFLIEHYDPTTFYRGPHWYTPLGNIAIQRERHPGKVKSWVNEKPVLHPMRYVEEVAFVMLFVGWHDDRRTERYFVKQDAWDAGGLKWEKDDINTFICRRRGLGVARMVGFRLGNSDPFDFLTTCFDATVRLSGGFEFHQRFTTVQSDPTENAWFPAEAWVTKIFAEAQQKNIPAQVR